MTKVKGGNGRGRLTVRSGEKTAEAVKPRWTDDDEFQLRAGFKKPRPKVGEMSCLLCGIARVAFSDFIEPKCFR